MQTSKRDNKKDRQEVNRKTKFGYILIYKPKHPDANKNGFVFEHRLVVENYIGRILKKEEVIHHINCNREDNRIENLMIFKSNKEHASFHTKIKQYGYLTNPIKRMIKQRWQNLK